ncbi:unnamed protein product [Pylaiella littoralis]
MALLKHMWTQSSEYKSAAAQDLTGDESGGDTIEINTGTFSAAAAAAAAAAERGAGEVAPSVGRGTGTGTETDATSPVGSKPVCDCKEECKLGDGIWECANPDADAACSFVDFVGSSSKENGGVHPSANAGAVAAVGLVAGGSAGAAAAGASKKLPEMPEGWFFQHLIMACAWSPWSGNTPSEWKGLCASSGKSQKVRGEDKLDLASNPLSSPEAMAAARKMLTGNGDSSSRRQTEAAVKLEAERVRRATKDKENLALMRESQVTRKKGVNAMEQVNETAVEMNKNLKRMADLREEANSFERLDPSSEAGPDDRISRKEVPPGPRPRHGAE